jgi:prepilin-type processing-associated H-X9-DG protein
VLAALLLPAVASAREKARQASCLSNLKQIGLGVIMYAADNDEVLPPDLAAPQPYIHNPQVYRCPSAEAGAAEVGFHSDYEYLGAGLGQSRIERPAETVLVVDNAARHSGGVNITFADGHARYLAVPSGQHWRAAAQAQGWVIPGGGVP